ncbi:hypothetical protein [Actinoplanes couchii]|uniref:PknH-like extracellular domain-containing protein n=1 Tax=Actinoplanes couchii TaxID=403638 RepID=A0ABQ3X0K6_9ACTN|nr:hypothetical protein [Actinoplanes couchii]MDR6316457.1 hypothetical protein [Actinoplanes couchii]GID52071.1 hypothetical protein Aco03nite_004750 [Actinoplanes couchii]
MKTALLALVLAGPVPPGTLLTQADGHVGPPVAAAYRAPAVCDADFPSDRLVRSRASIELQYRSARLSTDYIPTDTVHNTVTVYRAGGAAQFITELRTAVRKCPLGRFGARAAKFRLVENSDDALLVERSTAAYNDDGSVAGGRRVTWIAAVRDGDAVTMLETIGYESGTASPAEVRGLVKAAAKRLELLS